VQLQTNTRGMGRCARLLRSLRRRPVCEGSLCVPFDHQNLGRSVSVTSGPVRWSDWPDYTITKIKKGGFGAMNPWPPQTSTTRSRLDSTPKKIGEQPAGWVLPVLHRVVRAWPASRTSIGFSAVVASPSTVSGRILASQNPSMQPVATAALLYGMSSLSQDLAGRPPIPHPARVQEIRSLALPRFEPKSTTKASATSLGICPGRTRRRPCTGRADRSSRRSGRRGRRGR
jgi:hypothetical protein